MLLAQNVPEHLDLVVLESMGRGGVHALTHLLEANHAPRFRNIVRANVPATEKAQAWLEEHGAVIEEVIGSG